MLWKNQFCSIGPRSVSAKKSGVHLSYLQRSALSRQSSETNDVAKVNRHGVECFSDHGVPLDQLASHRPGTKLKPVVKSKYFSFVKTHSSFSYCIDSRRFFLGVKNVPIKTFSILRSNHWSIYEISLFRCLPHDSTDGEQWFRYKAISNSDEA